MPSLVVVNTHCLLQHFAEQPAYNKQQTSDFKRGSKTGFRLKNTFHGPVVVLDYYFLALPQRIANIL
jgi:hypothetical protein